MRSLSLLLVVMSLPALADNAAYDRLAIQYDLPEQIHPGSFAVCSQHDCQARTPIELDAASWQTLTAFFTPTANTAAEERAQIARAVAHMEHLVGPIANTAHDKAGDFNGFGEPGDQLDCIDESVNTTTYLTLFEQAGLLRWHRVRQRVSRGYFFFGGWPHFSAVVETTDAQPTRWVIDTWFRDNGVSADVLEVKTWQDGWSPEGFSM